MLAGWSFSFFYLQVQRTGLNRVRRENILMAKVDQLLSSGMQEPGNWGNRASVDNECVLVKMSVKTDPNRHREILGGLRPEGGTAKNGNCLPPALSRIISATSVKSPSPGTQCRHDTCEPGVFVKHRLAVLTKASVWLDITTALLVCFCFFYTMCL